jgi:hypothetical protein
MMEVGNRKRLFCDAENLLHFAGINILLLTLHRFSSGMSKASQEPNPED